MTQASLRPWATELDFDRAAKLLRVTFDDGAKFDIPFELLRVESPSAENKGHGGASKPPPVTGKANIGVRSAEPVGRYAVRINFDDGHDTGLYSWDLLYELGRDREAAFARYRSAVAALARGKDA